MTEKEVFVQQMKLRTKKLAVDVIALCNSLKACKASGVITYQLVKSATSTGANYRAACVSRSQKEFFSKICIVVEEADETEYWLEIILDSGLCNNLNELNRLILESKEITKVMTKAKTVVYKRGNDAMEE